MGRAQPQAAPAATRPATRPTTDPAQAARKVRQRVVQLTRKSLELIKANKLDEAEDALQEALLLDPTHSVNLYNMACIKAIKGRADAAIDYLERSALEGFTDFIHIEKDTDLDSLRTLPRFKQFLARKDEFQRKAADRVVSWLKHEFGDGYLYEIDAQDKLIFATNTDPQTLAATKKWLVAQAQSQWNELFEHRPDQYISVVLPSPADYKQIVSNPGVGGFYNHDNRILICQRLGQVMTHEFTHALHNADLDPLGQEHPIWLGEGLATLYESAQFEGKKLVPAENFRLTYLQSAVRRNRLIPLEKLFKMDQRSFVNQANLAYGESGSLLLYLYDHDLLRKFYDAYKAGWDKEKTGQAALETATGKPLAELEKDWRAWMAIQKPPTLYTGQHGVVLGVRFSDANDGLKINLVEPNGPAHRAGIKPEDLIVGIDGVDVRDQQSLIPILATHQAGDKVTVKIRRGSLYLDLPVTLTRRDEMTRVPSTRPAVRP